MAKKVLIIVDMQKDFMPTMLWTEQENTGALPVPGGLAIVPNIVKEAFSGYDKVIATRDFHPGNHSSFKELGGEWPMHCVAGSEGAQILTQIDMVADVILSKGQAVDEDGYSGFGSIKYNTGLSAILNDLQEHGEEPPEVVIVGVATDYCVRATALDAAAMGWKTTVLLDCVAGVAQRTTEEAILTMNDVGVTLRNRD